MARKYLIVYHSYLEAMEDLSDAECGRLIRSALKYSAMGELQELCGNEKILFKILKSQIDRDNEKYEKICETNKQNVEKRWEKENAQKKKEKKSGVYSNTKQQELSVEDKLKKIKSSYGDVCDLYNTVCSNLPKTNRMSQKRITRLYTLLRSGYSREDIRKVFEIANTSKFLCGKTKNSYFTATLDWLIVKENFEKVLEGNYKSETAENTKASNPKQGRKPSYDISNHAKYCEDLLFRAKSP